MAEISYHRHRFPPAIIRHAVWVYLRFTLSYRDVEELLAERRLDISSVRMITPNWVLLLRPSISGYRAASEFPPGCCPFPATPSLALTTVSRAGQVTARKPNQPDPEAGSRRARASDILLTQDAYKIEPAGRAGPSLGAASEMFPPDPALLSSRGFLAGLPDRRRVAAAVADRVAGSGPSAPPNRDRCVLITADLRPSGDDATS